MAAPIAVSGRRSRDCFHMLNLTQVSPEPAPKSCLCSPGQDCPSASTPLLNGNDLDTSKQTRGFNIFPAGIEANPAAHHPPRSPHCSSHKSGCGGKHSERYNLNFPPNGKHTPPSRLIKLCHATHMLIPLIPKHFLHQLPHSKDLRSWKFLG